jgi:hypothetical protein
MGQIRLEVILDQQTGALTVNGPVGNPMICYGMLEMAKDAIRKMALENAERRVQPATVIPMS